MNLRSYHYGHPKMEAAIKGTGEMLDVLQSAEVPDTVIVEAMLQEVIWMIDSIDVATAEAAAMRGVISWFSGQCADLVAPPLTGMAHRLDRH